MIIRVIAFIKACREVLAEAKELRREMHRKHGAITE
jgi:hypothetical protein